VVFVLIVSTRAFAASSALAKAKVEFEQTYCSKNASYGHLILLDHNG
jgi:hypothetical protein